jgi:hypothetical protein
MTLRSGTDPAAMRLDEVPELTGREGDLGGLSFDDVRIRPAIDGDGGTVGWIAVIIFEHRHGSTSHLVPWILGMRPSKKKARKAAVCLLEGLLKGQKKARREYPAISDLSNADHKALFVPVLEQIEDEWLARKRPTPPPAPATPARKRRAASTPRVPMTEEISEWARTARETRLRWGWSQNKLGAEVGVSGPRIGQFERLECGFPGDVIAKLAEVLDLDAP